MRNEHIAGGSAIVARMATNSVPLFDDFRHGANVDCRGARGRIMTVVAFACCALQMIGPAIAADRLRRLNAAEIRQRIVGNVVTDESHWSDRFESNGTLNAMELGQRKLGTWKLQRNEMCVMRKARKPIEECFELWISKDNIEYRRDGITLTTGVLSNK